MTAVMTKVMNRDRPRAELREALYETAIALFRECGFAATSVEAVTNAAGVAKGTFFNFFPSKIDVLKAYYARIDAEASRLRATLDPADPIGALGRYGREVEAILLREGRLMIELLQLTLSDAAMRRVDEASGSNDTGEFAQFLAAAQARGTLGAHVDPSGAAAALADLWSGAIRRWLAAPEPGVLARLFETRVAILFEGLEG